MNVSLGLVDMVLVLAVGVVLPLALGGPAWRWALAAAAVAGALMLPRGPAAVALVLPWVAVAAHGLVGTVRRLGAVRDWGLAGTAAGLAAAYGVVAAAYLVQSRAGIEAFGIGEPIVQMTAVHFAYAGAGALTLARWHLERSGGRSRLAVLAVVATGLAPPVVALGFVTGWALPQVGGAVVMTLGVWCTGWRQLVIAGRGGGGVPVRALHGISGAAVWAPMVLAVSWAAAQHWAVPALSIPDMARVHGTLNAMGFILCGLLGHHLSRTLAPSRPVPAEVKA